MPEENFRIRAFKHQDLDSLYEICLKTAASGEDGSSLFQNAPRSVGDMYATPYASFAPELVHILEDSDGPCGYVLGTHDTAAFEDWLADHWFPLMRQRYPWPEGDPADFTAAERLIRRFHQPVAREPRALLKDYPAHLHIDILPRGQGRGNGRGLMEAFLADLREQGVAGVHLGLGMRNHRALRFYGKLGFIELEKRGDPPNSLLMGLTFTKHTI